MPTTLRNTDILFNDSTTMLSGQQAAKAWVNFSGINGSIRASYNISSVTRVSAGTYTVNFSSPLADANYTIISNPAINTSYTQSVFATPFGIGAAPTTSSFSIIAWYAGYTRFDPDYVFAAVYR